MTLRPLLAGLALLTVAATVERLVELSAPMPVQEAPSAIRLEGYRVRARGGGAIEARAGVEPWHPAPVSFGAPLG